MISIPRVVALTLLGGAILAACFAGGASDDWNDHMGDIPFQIGDVSTGEAAFEATGRPPAYYFTSTH